MPDPLQTLRIPVAPVEPRQEFAAALRSRLEQRTGQFTPGAATARYFVTDLAAAVTFYTEQLGFAEELRAAPAFAMLYRGQLRLLLSAPGQPSQAAEREESPGPGGANRIVLGVPDLAATVARLRASGVRFRAGITTGITVRQALLEDPSGNLVELFEPLAGYHERQGDNR
ncbi:MAG TPA: VOC family protein [Streptosporangiaceae bacterium]|nr:VOC family protein [Streptosporangiaceae bacterium]